MDVKDFGPCRTIGIRYVGRNEHGEIPTLWQDEFLPRMREIAAAENACCFGLERCIPGATDGTFEYTAAIAARDDAPVPEGMVDDIIPPGRYAVIPVENLAGISAAYSSWPEWIAAHPEWTPYCMADACDCANHPFFEYYPPEFDGTGPLYLYFPVKPTP